MKVQIIQLGIPLNYLVLASLKRIILMVAEFPQAILNSFRGFISRFYKKFILEHGIVWNEDYDEVVMVHVSYYEAARGDRGCFAMGDA